MASRFREWWNRNATSYGTSPLPARAQGGARLVYDAQELARALERLAADRELLTELRRRARELALTRLNAEAAADTLVAAWEDGR